MAVTQNLGYATLLDLAKSKNPDGSQAKSIDYLSQRNPILQDAMAMEGNLDTGHQITGDTALPSGTFRRINQGIDIEGSTTGQVVETCSLFESRNAVDSELIRLNGGAQFRSDRDNKHILGMSNTIAGKLFTADTNVNPEQFLGFTPRYPATTGFVTSDYTINAGVGGSVDGNVYSMWFITWGTTYMIFPKGTTSGLEQKDLGEEYVLDKNGKPFLAYRTHFKWRPGLCVEDHRYNVRIANIDLDDTTMAVSATNMSFINNMVDAYGRIRDMSSGQTVIYCNRTVLTRLDQMLMARGNAFFTMMDWFGQRVASFRGVPIRVCDALATAETIIT